MESLPAGPPDAEHAPHYKIVQCFGVRFASTFVFLQNLVVQHDEGGLATKVQDFPRPEENAASAKIVQQCPSGSCC